MSLLDTSKYCDAISNQITAGTQGNAGPYPPDDFYGNGQQDLLTAIANVKTAADAADQAGTCSAIDTMANSRDVYFKDNPTSMGLATFDKDVAKLRSHSGCAA